MTCDQVVAETSCRCLAVLAAVALLARRLNTAPSILLVVDGVALALIPGIPPIELSPQFVLLIVLPPLILSFGGRRGNQWPRVPLQPAADRVACRRLRPIHDLRGGGGRPLRGSRCRGASAFC